MAFAPQAGLELSEETSFCELIHEYSSGSLILHVKAFGLRTAILEGRRFSRARLREAKHEQINVLMVQLTIHFYVCCSHQTGHSGENATEKDLPRCFVGAGVDVKPFQLPWRGDLVPRYEYFRQRCNIGNLFSF